MDCNVISCQYKDYQWELSGDHVSKDLTTRGAQKCKRFVANEVGNAATPIPFTLTAIVFSPILIARKSDRDTRRGGRRNDIVGVQRGRSRFVS